MKPCGGIFDLDRAQEELERIEAESQSPSFWDDAARAQEIMREKGRHQTTLETMAKERGHLDDAEVLLGLAREEGDVELIDEAAAELAIAERGIAKLEMMRMLSGPNDAGAAIVTVNSGAGGTESMDWAQMLLRMLLRYCERKQFQTTLIDMQAGEEAGLKSATFEVSGSYAYGLLKAESGVHRLVRISPFDSNARRHTSFASVFVFPLLADDIDIQINGSDLRVDTYRSSGAGGQHVNKTESAVRLTHMPTGIVVSCQSERSQHKNKDTAMKILRSRLYDQQRREKEEKNDAVNASKNNIDFGSQIRSYVLHPYQMVKDHRTNYESSNTSGILDGELDDIITNYLLFSAGGGDKSEFIDKMT